MARLHPNNQGGLTQEQPDVITPDENEVAASSVEDMLNGDKYEETETVI